MATSYDSKSFCTDIGNQQLTKIESTQGRRKNDQIHTSIGVKSHGTIEFSGDEFNRAKFIRVPPDASVTHVKELLVRQWCGGRPALVISIIGTTEGINMKSKLLRTFRRGLLQVARKPGAWIITGGLNTSVMKLVGEIIQSNPDPLWPIHLIGIATWGYISDRQQLDVQGSVVQYLQPCDTRRGEAPLEPNHTEFIFVDDGSENKYGRELGFRQKLEQALCQGLFTTHNTVDSSSQCTNSSRIRSSQRSDYSEPIPVVLLVIEGGPNTMSTVHEAIIQNNIPVIFFEGTGRCCDLFGKTFRLYKNHCQEMGLNEDSLEPNVRLRRHQELKIILHQELKDDLQMFSSAVQIDYFELVYECIHTRTHFVNVISNDSVELDIDRVILQALLNVTPDTGSNKKLQQLQLALEWDCIDIVKNYIMTTESDWQNMNLNDLFFLALTRNQIEFVKLFLDHDFSLTDLFRKNNNLFALYQNDMKIDTHANTSVDSLRTIYEDIIQPLIGDLFEVDAALPGVVQTDAHPSTDEEQKLSCFCCKPRYDRAECDVLTCHAGNPFDVDKELFLWSVITGRRDFALLFWSRGKNKICAALIATLLYRKYARKENDNSYSQSADEFEYLALQILNKFYYTNPQTCIKAIVRSIPAYGNVTCLELAVAAEAKEFIAQRPVQKVLSNIWYGCIDQRVSASTVVFSTIMPWYSGFLPYYNEVTKNEYETNWLRYFRNRPHLSQTQSDNDERIAKKLKKQILQYFQNIGTFIRAPYVKYLYNLYFHLLFLLLFSYVILCDFFPLYQFPTDVCSPCKKLIERGKDVHHENVSTSIVDQALIENKNKKSVSYGLERHERPSNSELVLILWVFTLFFEEIRQFFHNKTQSKRNMLIVYFEVYWNRLDVLAILLFFVGLLLRCLPSADCYCAARVVLAVDLSIWFLRSMNMFAAVKRLGPKLLMIRKMGLDLKFFMLLLFVFILAFGVPTYSLIYGVQKFSWHIPREIINLAYWQVFGELNTWETYEYNYNAPGYVVFILLISYIFVVSILLVNVLIAMFRNTFNHLQSDADRIWKYQRYLLVNEYLSRPSLPPPFILISHLWRSVLHIFGRYFKLECIQSTYKQWLKTAQYQTILDEKKVANTEMAEDVLGDEIYYEYLKFNRRLHTASDLDDQRIGTLQDNIFDKIQTLDNRIGIISHQQAHMIEYLECLMDGLKSINGECIRRPERGPLDPDETCMSNNLKLFSHFRLKNIEYICHSLRE